MNQHINMSDFVAAKSDQLNADDLMGGPRTVTVTRVTGNPDSKEQPVSVYYEGDGGKPFKPCLTMRRIMVAVWGPETANYPGRSMTLYRDPKVQFGGMQVGGIRISHMSDMERETVVAVMVTRGKKAPIKISPLKSAPRQQQSDAKDEVTVWAEALVARIQSAESADAILAIENEAMVIKRRQWMEKARPDLFKQIADAIAAGPVQQGRTEEQHGDQFPGDDEDPFGSHQ